MNKQLKLRMLSVLAALSLAIGLGIAVGQQTPPTESKGVSAKQIGALELGPEIEGMAGRQLRLRVVTLDTGGVFAVHSHKDRPTIEYILKGNVTEFKDGTAKEYHDGDSVLADKHTTHWWRNDGTAPAVFVAADVFHPTKQ